MLRWRPEADLLRALALSLSVAVARADCPVLSGPLCGATCTETCIYASDGWCDDGGSGSDFSEYCTLGTDCTDCGVRDVGAGFRQACDAPVTGYMINNVPASCSELQGLGGCPHPTHGDGIMAACPVSCGCACQGACEPPPLAPPSPLQPPSPPYTPACTASDLDIVLVLDGSGSIETAGVSAQASLNGSPRTLRLHPAAIPLSPAQLYHTRTARPLTWRWYRCAALTRSRAAAPTRAGGELCEDDRVPVRAERDDDQGRHRQV